MIKQYFKKYYSLNLSRLNILFNLFGVNKNSKKTKTNSFVFDNLDFNFFLSKNIDSKDFLLKHKYLLKMRSFENGSYKGYKNFRGLPLRNQRTKTNSRTNRKFIF